MPYCKTLKDGKLSFFLDNGLSVIPDGAFEISIELWGECMEQPNKYIEDAGTLKLNPLWVPPIQEPLPVVHNPKLVAKNNLTSANTIPQIKAVLNTYFSSQ